MIGANYDLRLVDRQRDDSLVGLTAVEVIRMGILQAMLTEWLTNRKSHLGDRDLAFPVRTKHASRPVSCGPGKSGPLFPQQQCAESGGTLRTLSNSQASDWTGG